jgi:hypothetical protein
MWNSVVQPDRAQVMWESVVQPDRAQMKIYYGVCALHAGKMKLQTHSEYVILIVFPRQSWLNESTPMLRHT